MPDSPTITWASQLKSSSSDPMTPRSSTDSLRNLKTSTASLRSLADRHSVESLRRALSKSSHGENRGRSTIMSKRVNADHPVYPDQSFASLGYIRPRSPLRTRSSHTTQVRRSPIQGAVTADNTPKTSPGLFTFPNIPSVPSLDSLEPQLHHLQTPKETYTAEIEHDTFSGNKFINNYEIVQELGRGEYGKVKLARNVETSALVAVKIVPRYSRTRRLGRLGAPEDLTKREVAILKKARHPNVVSLLEVIDDPNKNKVYLILEYIDKGEIKWRKTGVREVVAVMHARLDLERAGVRVTTDVSEKDLFTVTVAHRRHEALERARQNTSTAPNWSLEHGFEEDADLSRTVSNVPSRVNSHDDIAEQELAGSMYGAYEPEAYRGRAFSMAASTVSHMSSEINFDEEHSFVPAMTLEEARKAFRDTLLGLEFLHFIGIIHRDIKPANLLVASNGTVKISDFGVSYLGRSTGEDSTDSKLIREDVSEKDAKPLYNEKDLAKSVGTPAFWAPEICYEDPSIFEGGVPPKIGTALDLWALGITLYCMIYAQIPFINTGSGLVESICFHSPFMPRTRLVPVDTSMDKPSSTTPRTMNSNKRADYELKFEVVPDEVRDLIQRLLTKDPAHRITIAEAKKHPWVVEGLADPGSWIRGPDLEKEGKGRILEIDEREMSHAVGKRTIIEKALSTASRIAGSLLGRREGRKRAPSTATSRDSSESISPASTARDEQDRRRRSLKGDELLTALKASRDTEHPLAQSVTASPDVEKPSYFDDIKSASTGQTPDERPKPDRAISSLSTAESIRTIRPSHSEPIVEPGLKSRVEGLWEGTTRAFTRLASRDRRGDRSPSPFRNSFESEGRAGPSLALSTASVTGAIQKPDELQSSPPESPTLIRRHHSAILVPTSTDSAFEHAQDINQRRLIQEVQHNTETNSQRQRHESFDCPPSPDDIIFLHKQRLAEGPIQPNPSASTIASDFGSVSQSMSNPSFGMRSSASSPPGETFLSAEYKDLQEPAFMRTADTITQPLTGKPLEDEIEAYDDDDDDSEEEVMIMGGPKRK